MAQTVPLGASPPALTHRRDLGWLRTRRYSQWSEPCPGAGGIATSNTWMYCARVRAGHPAARKAIPPAPGHGVPPKPGTSRVESPEDLPARAAGDRGGFLFAVVVAQLFAQVGDALAAQGVALFVEQHA